MTEIPAGCVAEDIGDLIQPVGVDAWIATRERGYGAEFVAAGTAAGRL